MRIWIKFVFCLLTTLMACSFKILKQTKIVDYNTASERILGNAIKRVSKKYPLNAVGLGGGIDHKEKKNTIFDVMFVLEKKVTIDQARCIILDVLDTFLYYANNDPEVAPFLKPFPYTQKGFHIALFVYNSKGEKILHPNISVISLSLGKISYTTEEYEGEFTKDVDEHIETVEEAREILAKQLSQGSQ
ncbi:MAG: hypothetical protein Tsb0021_08590 [Chlamydiales bacterium]